MFTEDDDMPGTIFGQLIMIQFYKYKPYKFNLILLLSFFLYRVVTLPGILEKPGIWEFLNKTWNFKQKSLKKTWENLEFYQFSHVQQ